MELNYSKQDLELLVSEAERLVMTKCNDHHHHGEWSSDSDYESRASREWLSRALETSVTMSPTSVAISATSVCVIFIWRQYQDYPHG